MPGRRGRGDGRTRERDRAPPSGGNGLGRRRNPGGRRLAGFVGGRGAGGAGGGAGGGGRARRGGGGEEAGPGGAAPFGGLAGRAEVIGSVAPPHAAVDVARAVAA